jgi:hypothetical protein
MLARVTNVGGGFAAVRQLVHICDIGGSRTAYGDVSQTPYICEQVSAYCSLKTSLPL